MSWSYNFGSNVQIDAVRLMVADTDATKPIFQDEEILMMYQLCATPVFVAPGRGISQFPGTVSPRFVAAGLLEALAANKSRTAAALMVLDIQVQPATAAQELRKTAEALRDAERNSGAFGIIELNYNDFSARDRWLGQLLRVQGA